MDNAIGIDVEGDFHLGHPSGSRGQSDQVELTQGSVVSCHFSLALQHLDAHLGLVVCRCAEGLRLLGGDGGVPANGYTIFKNQNLLG